MGTERKKNNTILTFSFSYASSLPAHNPTSDVNSINDFKRQIKLKSNKHFEDVAVLFFAGRFQTTLRYCDTKRNNDNNNDNNSNNNDNNSNNNELSMFVVLN